MQPEISERLMGMLDYLESSVKTAGTFVAEQTPIVVQEYLRWSFWSPILVAIPFVLVGIAVMFVALAKIRPAANALEAEERRSWAETNRRYSFSTSAELHGLRAAQYALTTLSTLVVIVATGVATFNSAKVALAPRVVIVEAIGDLAKALK